MHDVAFIFQRTKENIIVLFIMSVLFIDINTRRLFFYLKSTTITCLYGNIKAEKGDFFLQYTDVCAIFTMTRFFGFEGEAGSYSPSPIQDVRKGFKIHIISL